MQMRKVLRPLVVSSCSLNLSGVSSSEFSPIWCSTRHQGYVPSKGYREQPAVPDRLKDAMAMMGVDPHSVNQEEHFVPEEKRGAMIQNVLSQTQYMRSYQKVDRLRVSLDAVRNEPPESEKWNEVYLFLRTTEMCTEVIKNESDVFPKGNKLWIEMQLCEEKRYPPLCRLPNGMLVLPIFSMEEYMDHYFSLLGIFESTWFPSPRGGSQYEKFCQLDFPVGVTGDLQHHAAFATISHPRYQFGILLNPGCRSSKFITYPEMVQMAKLKRIPKRKRKSDLYTVKEDGTLEPGFDTNLLHTFDTQKIKFERITPDQIDAAMRGRPPIPPVAQLELHLLLCSYPEIDFVFIRTVDRPRWKQILGSSPIMTQIDVVCLGGEKPDTAFIAHLYRWSFLKEFNSDVHIELTKEKPSPPAAHSASGTQEHQFMCVYTAEDGEMLRKTTTFKGLTLAEGLGYNDPLLDEHGRKHFDYTKDSYF